MKINLCLLTEYSSANDAMALQTSEATNETTALNLKQNDTLTASLPTA